MDSIDIKNLSNENILELFQVLTSPNPEQERISLAQNILKKYIEIPQSLDSFLYQLTTNNNPDIRQFSSIMLYKSIDFNWEEISNQKQEEIKQKILELYSKEKTYKVLKGIGFAIFKICKKTLIANKWDYLLDMIFSSPEKYNNEQEKKIKSFKIKKL